MAQFKLRLPESLRVALDQATARSGQSLNTEIVQRLDRSVWQEQALGTPEMAGLAFTMAATFAAATQGKDWRSDPIAYAQGVAAVLDALIRGMPAGPDKALAIEGIVGRLLSLIAQAKEETK